MGSTGGSTPSDSPPHHSALVELEWFAADNRFRPAPPPAGKPCTARDSPARFLDKPDFSTCIFEAVVHTTDGFVFGGHLSSDEERRIRTKPDDVSQFRRCDSAHYSSSQEPQALRTADPECLLGR